MLRAQERAPDDGFGSRILSEDTQDVKFYVIWVTQQEQ